MAGRRERYLVKRQVKLFIAFAGLFTLASMAASAAWGPGAAAPFLVGLLLSPYLAYLVVLRETRVKRGPNRRVRR